MYLAYYNLNVKPFKITPDPKFLWLGETHKEALAILKYGIFDNRGFLLLVGDVGTGKTTLINGLLESLNEDTIVATVTDPGLDILDFYNFLAVSFKMNRKFTTKGDFLVHFIYFLHKVYAANKKVLLIIDEAQRLSHEMLEEIRLLSNIEKKDEKLLNIFLVGQNELNETLAETKNRALLQRITTKYDIGPLKKSEVKDYIQFRLNVAGTQRKLFTTMAIREIIAFSQCYPRLINVICDHALLTGFVKEKEKIDAAIIKECVKELSLFKVKKKTLRSLLCIKDRSITGIEKKPALLKPACLILIILLLFIGGYNYYFSDNDKKQSGNLTESKTDILIADVTKNNKVTPDLSAKNNVNRQPEFNFNTPKQTSIDNKKLPKPYGEDKLIINILQNSDELSPKSYKLLDRFVQRIKIYPDAAVTIKGYTDSSGSSGYNKILSKFRANNVKSYLAGQGVDSLKIKSIGMGPANPIASNKTSAGRAKNRRIILELIHL